MSPLQEFGKSLIILGAVIAVVGLFLVLVPKIPWLGRLPGDILVKKEHYSYYFPLGTCLLISIVLSLILWLFRR
ncbi:MAG: DUF2905 domain-containing protein [Deltaproteobacteria bacterium]|nr:DUF2905 domain-containing protein [Deltaproteobacteria bacterium]